jgi:hypothetical protein
MNFYVDADPDPDPDRHQNSADPRGDPTPSITLVRKSEFFYFVSQHCQFTMFYISHQCQMCHNFSAEVSLERSLVYHLFHLF